MQKWYWVIKAVLEVFVILLYRFWEMVERGVVLESEMKVHHRIKLTLIILGSRGINRIKQMNKKLYLIKICRIMIRYMMLNMILVEIFLASIVKHKIILLIKTARQNKYPFPKCKNINHKKNNYLCNLKHLKQLKKVKKFHFNKRFKNQCSKKIKHQLKLNHHH